jgi:hypothetical protein
MQLPVAEEQPGCHAARLGNRKNNAILSGNHFRRAIMGKYFIAWLLGVPAFVLVLIYLIF